MSHLRSSRAPLVEWVPTVDKIRSQGIHCARMMYWEVLGLCQQRKNDGVCALAPAGFRTRFFQRQAQKQGAALFRSILIGPKRFIHANRFIHALLLVFGVRMPRATVTVETEVVAPLPSEPGGRACPRGQESSGVQDRPTRLVLSHLHGPDSCTAPQRRRRLTRDHWAAPVGTVCASAVCALTFQLHAAAY